jgi:hypothetical protein
MEVKRDLDSKYEVVVKQGALGELGSVTVRNKLTGEIIPEDEPLFVLRGRDKLALKTLRYYFALCQAENCTFQHLNGLRDILRSFNEFVNQHADRMKEPGSTFRRGPINTEQVPTLDNPLGDKR